MRALVAMSGGVESSVAAALLLQEGHEVVGATMKLWGGPSDSGCCSVADVEDARRVCQQLGIAHHVFNFTAEFDRDVVEPYVSAHTQARTPNPCISCNAHLKFDRFLVRARLLGFEAIATGHHARVTSSEGGWQLRRGYDQAKDQSYVLYMLGQDQLAQLRLPVGELTKHEVRHLATELGLRTAAKPDSQDVCFISRTGGRESFLGARIGLGPGRLVATSGDDLGSVEALELVTVGQRRGLGQVAASQPERRYVVDVDLDRRTATLGSLEDLLVGTVEVGDMCWSNRPLPAGTRVEAQLSAHGRPLAAHWEPGRVVLDERARRVAPGQAVVLYLPAPAPGGDVVAGGGTAI
jgi:tRNA-specific 2-thiouridylase